MNPWPVEAAVAEVHLPRPGHADLVGTQKYGLTDVRDILERASARETAARVAGGAVAKAFLRALGVEVFSHVIQITAVTRPAARRPDARPTSRTSTNRPCAAWIRTRARRWSRRSTVCARRTSRSAACSRCARSGSCPGWARTSRGRSGSTAGSRQAILSIQAIKGVSIGDGFEVAGVPGSAGPRRDLLGRGARLLPRDEPRGRGRGRDDHRRAAGRARLDEAAADADQAAALGRHRDPRAGRGAARANRLVHRAGGRRRRRGDGRVRARGRLPARSSAATTSTTSGRRCAHTRSGSDGGRPEPGDGGPVRAARRAIVCIGFMGAGKTTAARSAADALGTEAVDVDAVIERRLGKPIERMFDEDGEAAFRAIEEQVTLELLSGSGGAGAVARRRRDRQRGGARRARRPARDLARRRRRDGVAPRAGDRRGRWRAIAAGVRARCTSSASRSTRRWRT